MWHIGRHGHFISVVAGEYGCRYLYVEKKHDTVVLVVVCGVL
jgi:hypothetical protein